VVSGGAAGLGLGVGWAVLGGAGLDRRISLHDPGLIVGQTSNKKNQTIFL